MKRKTRKTRKTRKREPEPEPEILPKPEPEPEEPYLCKGDDEKPVSSSKEAWEAFFTEFPDERLCADETPRCDPDRDIAVVVHGRKVCFDAVDLYHRHLEGSLGFALKPTQLARVAERYNARFGVVHFLSADPDRENVQRLRRLDPCFSSSSPPLYFYRGYIDDATDQWRIDDAALIQRILNNRVCVRVEGKKFLLGDVGKPKRHVTFAEEEDVPCPEENRPDSRNVNLAAAYEIQRKTGRDANSVVKEAISTGGGRKLRTPCPPEAPHLTLPNPEERAFCCAAEPQDPQPAVPETGIEEEERKWRRGLQQTKIPLSENPPARRAREPTRVRLRRKDGTGVTVEATLVTREGRVWVKVESGFFKTELKLVDALKNYVLVEGGPDEETVNKENTGFMATVRRGLLGW